MRRNSPILGRARWAALTVLVSALAGLFVGTSAALAVVVNDNSAVAGVALAPNGRLDSSLVPGYLSPAGVSVVTSTGACTDPAAATEPDILTAGSWPLSTPTQPICWHGGPVMHANETFTLEWEGQNPNTYWSTTKSYVQSFLSDVAANSGNLVNPYSDTTQYWDGASVQDRAAYSSVFGGGCDDNGTAKCQFGSVTGSGPGNSLPSSNCPVVGNNVLGGTGLGGGAVTVANNRCITDSQIQSEVQSLISNDGLIQYTKPGHTPLVNVLTPPGVVVCLDTAGKLCSANAGLTPPPPVLSTATTGGNVPAGDWQVEVTYLTSSGENLPSAPTTVTTTGSTSTINISSPPFQTGVTGWYAYVTPAGGTDYVRQSSLQNGVQTYLNQIGNGMVITDLSGAGPNPPSTPAVFCSYHNQVNDPQTGRPVAYVVQPWTAFSECDDPDVPALPPNPPPPVEEKSAGQRLASPLSQSDMAAITNPQLNGWFGLDGMEIMDQNACQGLGKGLDTFNFGTSGDSPYYLQREFNNTSVVDSDPYTYSGCLPSDVLDPTFVSPVAINLGDTIDLDGSSTGTSLAIPNANYAWSFGDGTTGTGPSVEHTYAKAGTYSVALTVTDRGGNTETLTQGVQVLGSNGLPVPSGPVTVTPGTGTNLALTVRLQLLPQGLRNVLNRGVTLQVTSTEPANGFATISISRKAARRAHIRTGRSQMVVIGTGTVWQVKDGTVVLHLGLSSNVAKKLKHLKHVTLSIRLALVDSAGKRVAVDVAGNY